jgi:hypothetical protein
MKTMSNDLNNYVFDLHFLLLNPEILMGTWDIRYISPIKLGRNGPFSTIKQNDASNFIGICFDALKDNKEETFKYFQFK